MAGKVPEGGYVQFVFCLVEKFGILKLFEKGERQTELENLMGDSKWVKINNNKRTT